MIRSTATPSSTSQQVATAPALEIDSVTAGYGTTTVLREISFTVAAGEICALLGPNGAGKTTLLRAVTGLLHIRQGHIRLNGQPMERRRPHARTSAGICLIPEGRGIFRSLTVRDNLRLQAPPGRGSAKAAIGEALDLFPALRTRLDVAAGNLSGGQQQMVALARACVSRPKLILVDEASMGLAPVVVDDIFQTLQAIARSGVAMVVVEQYVTRALAMAQHAVLLHKGSVAFDGPADRLDEQTVLSGYLGLDADIIGGDGGR